MLAKEKMEDSDRIEKIQMMVMNYVSKVENAKESLPTYLTTRVGKEIDSTMQLFDPREGHMGERVNTVTKDGHYYMILENENGDYIVEEMNTDLDAGGGIVLATPENFKGGTMTFDNGEESKSTLVFSDKIDAEYNFDIRSGEVTIYIDKDMTLTNKDVEPKRSAINIEPNAKLNLYIAKDVTLTVDSGYGEQGEIGSSKGAKGGPRWIRRDKSSIK